MYGEREREREELEGGREKLTRLGSETGRRMEVAFEEAAPPYCGGSPGCRFLPEAALPWADQYIAESQCLALTSIGLDLGVGNFPHRSV